MRFNYWDNHYSQNGVSGDGDTDPSRYWKMGILNEYGLKYDADVIDVGCGDMEFWKELPVKKYTGIDISPTIVRKNRGKYPKYQFFCADSSEPLKLNANYVTCFDMLFHIMDTTKYIMTLNNLTYYSNDMLFIYTWLKNPFDDFKNRLFIGQPFKKNMVTDGKFQYYRDFNKYSIRYIEPYFDILDIRTDDRWPYGAMFIYKRNQTRQI